MYEWGTEGKCCTLDPSAYSAICGIQREAKITPLKIANSCQFTRFIFKEIYKKKIGQRYL